MLSRKLCGSVDSMMMQRLDLVSIFSFSCVDTWMLRLYEVFLEENRLTLKIILFVSSYNSILNVLMPCELSNVQSESFFRLNLFFLLTGFIVSNLVPFGADIIFGNKDYLMALGPVNKRNCLAHRLSASLERSSQLLTEELSWL